MSRHFLACYFLLLFLAGGTEKLFTGFLYLARPAHAFACRTQIEVELQDGDIHALKKYPLGNHHLVLPGDFLGPLRALAALLYLKIINRC